MTASAEKSYTGTVVSVDPSEHMLRLTGFLKHRNFDLGTPCSYILLDNPAGAITGLRPGQKVTVRYLKAEGVLVADPWNNRPCASTAPLGQWMHRPIP